MFINNKAHNKKIALASDLDRKQEALDVCVRKIITQTYREKKHDFMLCYALIALNRSQISRFESGSNFTFGKSPVWVHNALVYG